MGKHGGNQGGKPKRKHLTPQQLQYAEWLAKPDWARIPKTEKDLADILGVSDQSLSDWKHLPELWEARDEALDNRMRNLVPQAAGILERAVKNPGNINKVTFDAAKQIIKEWGESKRRSPVLATFQDLREKYDF